MSTARELTIVLAMWALALAWSAVAPADRLTWLLETAPVMIAAPLMLLTTRSFPLTRVLLWAAFVHGLILILGGHYTYAEVPLGFWLQDLFDFSRNHYDRIGHLAQGFVPALLTREILRRAKTPVDGKLLIILSISVPLAFSALSEIIEWLAALSLGQGADAFLGTQGDEWDTQTDMFMALIGAIVALVTLSKLQDRQLERGGKA
jgi:putative membrane protein